MNIVELIEKENCKENVPSFRVGDTVKVYFKIVEGAKERIQVFEGLVIARKNGSVRETFTVRKISFGVGVERTFPLHSPRIDKIEVMRQGAVRRAKLYYIRNLSGKAGVNVKEKINANTKKKIERTEDEKIALITANKAKSRANGVTKKAPRKTAKKAVESKPTEKPDEKPVAKPAEKVTKKPTEKTADKKEVNANGNPA
jgi:large subunit ribosomal protein L19